MCAGDGAEAADQVRGRWEPRTLGAPHLLYQRGGRGERELQGKIRGKNVKNVTFFPEPLSLPVWIPKMNLQNLL